MAILTDNAIAAWKSGKIELPALLSTFNLSHRALGEMMGFPMPQYIVTIRYKEYRWPFGDAPRVDVARMAYDAGRVEVCQGRTAEFVILYSIPRKKYTKERPYFTRYGQE
jgi:hypothetical protein